MKHLRLAVIAATFIACATAFGQTINTHPTTPSVDGSKAAAEAGIKSLTAPSANTGSKTNATTTAPSKPSATVQSSTAPAVSNSTSTPSSTSDATDSSLEINWPLTVFLLVVAVLLGRWVYVRRQAAKTPVPSPYSRASASPATASSSNSGRPAASIDNTGSVKSTSPSTPSPKSEDPTVLDMDRTSSK